ncbi:MAG: sodium/solute symporter [Acidobacteria bacterium]|nr:sodium/solute symporter [Acidobacteriota bacterium]
MGKTIDTFDWTIIALYACCLGVIALYHSKKLKRQDDIFLAGRSMSRWPVAISMYMALFSTNSFVGLVGWVNRDRGTIWIALQNIGIISAVPLVIWLYPSLFYRLRISTAYEYLEKRFNYAVRAFASLFFIGARIMWMSTMLYAASLVISMMLGWTEDRGIPEGNVYAILLIGALGIFFALSGGMHAVIWTDVAQFFVVMTGVSTMVYLSVSRSGGIGEVLATAAAAGKFDAPSWFSLTDDISILSVFLFGFIAYLSNTGADQLVIQTYLSAKSEREIKASLWRSGFLLKPISIIFPALGILTFVFYQSRPDLAALMRVPDDALPVFVVHVLPSGIRGLMVAAIMSALLTSLEGGMAALSAAAQVDFIRRWGRPMKDSATVLLGRALIFFWGSTVIGIALWIRTLGENNNIIQILNIVMYPFVGVLLGIFLLGMLTRRAVPQGVLIGAIAGFLTTVAFPLSGRLVDILIARGMSFAPNVLENIRYLNSISNFFYVILGFGATMLFGYATSLFFPSPRFQQLEGLTRFSLPAPEKRSAAEGTSAP